MTVRCRSKDANTSVWQGAELEHDTSICCYRLSQQGFSNESCMHRSCSRKRCCSPFKQGLSWHRCYMCRNVYKLYLEQTVVWLQAQVLIINHQTFTLAIKSLWDKVIWEFFLQFNGSLMDVWEHFKLIHSSMYCYEATLRLHEPEVFSDEPGNSLKLV